MTEEQNIVYVRGMILQAEIEMNAMIAANQECVVRGATPIYGHKDFMALIEKQGVYHNSLVTNLCGQ